MTIVYVLNTNNQVSISNIDKAWAILVSYMGSYATSFEIVNSQRSIQSDLERFGTVTQQGGFLRPSVICGPVTPEFLRFLIEEQLRERLDWFKLYKDNDVILEHYDCGGDVFAHLSEEQFKSLSTNLKAQSLDPNIMGLRT